ncbi:hypothetical protein A6K24_13810 [Metabacillus litoralis]|uniref:Uncharacterized protein n=2 Tax=Metabacillus TaxID=2675233 RepID=A0A179SME6_9BACI|nr:hypothetical protein A6K24_13810 [Metabacillus litoralis]QNF29794.1 hypothetical protein HUW50_21250 [Metabacillus sp. KUDC1714]
MEWSDLKVYVIHFIENNSVQLVQLVNNIPSVDENIKIKGRKGKVLSVKTIEENKVLVNVLFEKVNKNQPNIKDTKKKR